MRLSAAFFRLLKVVEVKGLRIGRSVGRFVGLDLWRKKVRLLVDGRQNAGLTHLNKNNLRKQLDTSVLH